MLVIGRLFSGEQLLELEEVMFQEVLRCEPGGVFTVGEQHKLKSGVIAKMLLFQHDFYPRIPQQFPKVSWQEIWESGPLIN